jgi:hypothetical protein
MSRHCKPLKRAGGSDCADIDGAAARANNIAAQENARTKERMGEAEPEKFITAAIVNAEWPYDQAGTQKNEAKIRTQKMENRICHGREDTDQLS